MTTTKPKLTKADTAITAPTAAFGPGPTPSFRTLICRNATLAQFAAILTSNARGYTENQTVVDTTGITGNYDFGINFSNVTLLQSAGPNGAVSLLDAMEKQYGLKLEKQKKPMPLVIDHVDRVPKAHLSFPTCGEKSV